MSGKWGLYSAKSVCFIIFANVPAHLEKWTPSRRGCRCPHSPAVPQAVAHTELQLKSFLKILIGVQYQTASIELAADLRRGLPRNLLGGYA